MKKLFLLGGENVSKRNAKEINREAFKAAGIAKILVFPWARASFDKKYRTRKLLTDYFLSLSALEVNFVDYGESKESIKEVMANSTVIYLTGGQPSILIERLKKSGVAELLQNYNGIIVGRSAGALALCKKCVTTTRSNQKVRIVNGVGLVDFTLKAHYIPEDEPILKYLSLSESIIAVPEKSAVVWEDGMIGTLGRVYLFSKGVRYFFTCI